MAGLTVQGAFGRDYANGLSMAQAFLSGVDFRGTNPGLGLMGTLFSIRDLPKMGVDEVTLRYDGDREFALCRYKDGELLMQDPDLENTWQPIKPEEPRAPVQGTYCRGCGDKGDGDCKELQCVELTWDSVVDAFCPCCGTCRQVEADARNYECHSPGCFGKITSPFELLI